MATPVREKVLLLRFFKVFNGRDIGWVFFVVFLFDHPQTVTFRLQNLTSGRKDNNIVRKLVGLLLFDLVGRK